MEIKDFIGQRGTGFEQDIDESSVPAVIVSRGYAVDARCGKGRSGAVSAPGGERSHLNS
jgi:hypothetical protein